MPEIIVKGIDSADAMEQVERLLGPDALILKTVRRGTQVEITATTDEPAGPRRIKPNSEVSQEPTTNRAFSHMLAESLKKQHAAGLDTPQDPPVLSQSETPAPPADDPKPKETDTSPVAAQSPLVLPAGGAVILGPSGGGKSQLALQMAASFVEQTGTKPRLIFVGQGSLADAAYLSAKARIMGIAVLHRTVSDLDDATVSYPDRDIIVASDSVSPDVFANVTPTNGRILVLPTGLTPTAQSAILAHWSQADRIILTQCDVIPASQFDMAFQSDTNIPAIGISLKSKILGALFDLGDLNTAPMHDTPATAPQTKAPSIFKNRWAGIEPTNSQSSGAINTQMPMLGTRSANSDTKVHQKEGAEQ